MINKGNTKEILINNNDVKLKNVSKDFLKILEKDFEKYVKKYDDLNTINEKYKEDNSYYFIPEKLTKKSPLTIINGPWGSGKTHFIENFLKLFIDSDIKSNIFKKMTIIDAWRFSDSKDVPIQFIFELSQILLKINNIKLKEECFKPFLKKIFNKLAPTSFVVKLDFGLLKFESHWNKNEKMKSEKEALNIIRNSHEKTIIFIDNLERLGSFSWDLLKSVLKLQEFKNYLIILALNSNKLKNNETIKNNNEYPIEKYIDITMFDFKQDYYGFFYNETNNKQESKILNSVFNDDIDGEKLSIREVQQSSNANDLFNKEYNLFDKLEIIYNEIWPNKKKIEEKLRSIVEEYFNFWIKKDDLLSKIYKNLVSKNDNEDFNNFYKLTKEHLNKIFDWEDYQKYYTQFNINYMDELEKMKQLIQKEKEIVTKKLIKLKNNKILLEKEMSNKENIISENKTKIRENKSFIDTEKEKDKFDSKKTAISEVENKNLRKKNKDLKKENNENKIILGTKKEEISAIEKIVNNVYFDELIEMKDDFSNIDKNLNEKIDKKIQNIIFKYIIFKYKDYYEDYHNKFEDVKQVIKENIINILKELE